MAGAASAAASAMIEREHFEATKEDGTFVRGGIEVVVLAGDRADEAERILSA